MTDQNQIVQVIEQSDLPKPKVQALMETFAPAFQEARLIVEAAKKIKVTDENDTEGMQLAREKRLALKDIRVTVEKTRKELKEQSLREGRAIDGAANILKALIVPAEEHLQQQEKYAELLEEKRLTERYQKRLNLLEPYVDDTSLYKLKEMSDAAFDNLLNDCKTAHEQKIAAEKKAEAERVENERKQKLFTERRIELAPYKDFLPADFELTIDTPETQYGLMLDKVKSAKAEHDKKQAAIAEQAKKDREAREAAEAKLKAEQEAQAKKEAAEKARLAAEQKQKEEQERQAVLAPDKVKLTAFADNIHEFTGKYPPALKSNDAQNVLNQAIDLLNKAEDLVRAGTKKL